MRKSAMTELRDKLLEEIENLKEESQPEYRQALINVANDIDAQMLSIESKMVDDLTNAIKEIENAMERWHHARANDIETLEKINQSLVDIGLLGWFNKDKQWYKKLHAKLLLIQQGELTIEDYIEEIKTKISTP